MEEFCRNFADLPDVRSEYDDFPPWMQNGDSELNELWGGNMLMEPAFDNRGQPNMNGLNTSGCSPVSTDPIYLNPSLAPQSSNDSLRLFCDNPTGKNTESSIFSYQLGGNEGPFPKDLELTSIGTVDGAKPAPQEKEAADSLSVPPLFVPQPTSDTATAVCNEVKVEEASSQAHLAKLKSLDDQGLTKRTHSSTITVPISQEGYQGNDNGHNNAADGKTTRNFPALINGGGFFSARISSSTENDVTGNQKTAGKTSETNTQQYDRSRQEWEGSPEVHTTIRDFSKIVHKLNPNFRNKLASSLERLSENAANRANRRKELNTNTMRYEQTFWSKNTNMESNSPVGTNLLVSNPADEGTNASSVKSGYGSNGSNGSNGNGNAANGSSGSSEAKKLSEQGLNGGSSVNMDYSGFSSCAVNGNGNSNESAIHGQTNGIKTMETEENASNMKDSALSRKTPTAQANTSHNNFSQCSSCTKISSGGGGRSPKLSRKCTCQAAIKNSKDQESLSANQYETEAPRTNASTSNGHTAENFGEDSNSLTPSTQYVDKAVAAMLFNKLG